LGTFIPRLRDFEQTLLRQYSDEIQSNQTPIIAIGGFSGTGKDTVAAYVQEYFQKYHGFPLKLTHAGESVRKIAVESGWSEENMDEFMAHIKNTQDTEFAENVDIGIEKHALKTALLEGGIFVGRMAPFAIGTHGTTIWLEVAAQVIAQRISNDPKRAEYQLDQKLLVEKIQSRDRTDGERLERIYQVSFRDKKNFDLTLRNEGISTNQLRELILDLLKSKHPPKSKEI
jgi:cytidylate kinase